MRLALCLFIGNEDEEVVRLGAIVCVSWGVVRVSQGVVCVSYGVVCVSHV
jgi:hypothetical protein